MLRPREKLSNQVCTSFTNSELEKVNEASIQLGISRAELIRLCVLNHMPLIIKREIKRKSRQDKDIERNQNVTTIK